MSGSPPIIQWRGMSLVRAACLGLGTPLMREGTGRYFLVIFHREYPEFPQPLFTGYGAYSRPGSVDWQRLNEAERIHSYN